MARIENTSEREIHLTLGPPGKGRTFIIPRGKAGESGKENGVCAEDVPDALLKDALDETSGKGDAFTKHFFSEGDLIVVKAKGIAAARGQLAAPGNDKGGDDKGKPAA